MRPAPANPALALARWWRQLPLAWPLAKRDIMARYRGSLAGVAWALLAPLAMVAVYTLVFRGVFQARWGSAVAGDGFHVGHGQVGPGQDDEPTLARDG